MPSETDQNPSPFKIDSSNIRGWEHTTLDLSINNPEMLKDGGDYTGAGAVLVAFDDGGKVLAIRYLDGTTSGSTQQTPLSASELMSEINGAAFVETMRATDYKTLVINNIYRMTDIGHPSRSNIGFTGRLAVEGGGQVHFKAGRRVPGKAYNVHVYREVRFRFDNVIAGSRAEAAMTARDKLIAGERAGEVDATEGLISSAVVDLADDANYEQTKWFTFGVPVDADPKAPDYVTLANELFDGLVRLEASIFRETDGADRLKADDLTWLRALILKTRYRLGRD